MTRVAGRAVWILAALLSGSFLPSIFHQPVGWPPLLFLGLLALMAALRPYEALLLFTGLFPLATMIFLIIRTEDVGVHYHEAMALAFLGGLALRRIIAPRPSGLPPWTYACTVVLLALVVASGIVTSAILVAEEPAYQPVELLRTLTTRDYLNSTNPVTAAGLFAGGLLLMLAASEIAAEDPTRRRALARMLVIGAAAAASLNIVRIAALALSRGGAWPTFFDLLATLRVNVHFSDWNAAGSYFAMAFFIALGLCKDSRTLAVVCAFLTAVGLWVSGSRTALLAMLIVAMLVGVAVLWRAGRRALALGTVGALIALTVALAVFYPRERNAPARIAWQIRASLARGAFDMAAAQPVFGVGVGRYYVLSTPYTMKQYIRPRENAHNYFLQILAELGVPGLMLFLSMILLAMHEGVRHARDSLLIVGLIAGVTTYAVTCLAGHPLLVDGAAFPFWIALALVATRAPERQASRSRAPVFLVVALAAIAASLPFRLSRAEHHADLEHAAAGFSLWQREPDGSRYRWAGGRSRFYAPAGATAVRIPLRAGGVASSPVEVQINIDDRKADRVIVEPGGDWTTLRLLLPRRSSGRFTKIELETFVRGAPRPADAKLTDSNGLLMVGRAEYEFPTGATK